MRCGYHGITFDAEGHCTRIPSQAHTPKVYKLKKYPLAEHGHWLFIWPGDPQKADPNLLPDLNAYDWQDPVMRFRPFFFKEVAGRYQLLNDNLLDLTHLAYLHGNSIGVEDNATIPEEREETPTVLKSRRVMRGSPMMPVHRGRFGYDGLIDRLSSMDFYLPGFHAGRDQVSIPSDHPTRSGEVLTRNRVFHAVTPAKLNSCNYFFSMGGTLTDEQFDRAAAQLEITLDEDIMATCAIEEMLGSLSYCPDDLMLKSDVSAVQGRRRLQTMMDQEAAVSSSPSQRQAHS